jgi:hypothetical protein
LEIAAALVGYLCGLLIARGCLGVEEEAVTQNAMRKLAVDIMAEALRQGATAIPGGKDGERVAQRARLAYVELMGREPVAVPGQVEKDEQ